MDQKNRNKSKRLYLQGIRGVAIIVVLCFHFFPETFPNGYLGVDQFFVLSGFLMCMLLKRGENLSIIQQFSLFYLRRFRRILPLYLCVILVSMCFLYTFFPVFVIETNHHSAMKSLLFTSNKPKSEQEDYFQMLATAVNIFTHTWSISVEVQFYILAPVLFLMATKFQPNYHLHYYGLIGCASFLFYCTSSSPIAFKSLGSRIWQFLTGMVVYLIENIKNQHTTCFLKDQEKFKSTKVILVALLATIVFPFSLPATITRLFVTFGTGLLILISEDNWFLSYKALSYFGDISYALYLVHWPIYAYWKLSWSRHQLLLAVALATSIIISVIVFETFEKWYLQLCNRNCVLLVLFLLVLNVLAVNKDEISDQYYIYSHDISSLDNVTSEMTIDDAARSNYRWIVNDITNLFAPSCEYENKKIPLGKCWHKGLPMNGKYKLAIVGNSWTANHAAMFYQACGHKANSIIQFSSLGCEPLYPSEEKFLRGCESYFKKFEEQIKLEQPDYAFLISRFISVGSPFPSDVTNFQDDPVHKIMKKQMLGFLPNIKHKLYILNAIPMINGGVISNIVPMIKNNTDPEMIDEILVKPQEYKMARNRNEQLVKDCKGRCILIDYLPKFYNTSSKEFRYFDNKGFSYWTEGLHLTPHGINHIKPIWTDICEKL